MHACLQDGELDPADVHVDGVPTIEEELQMAAEKRYRKRLLPYVVQLSYSTCRHRPKMLLLQYCTGTRYMFTQN